MLYLRIAAFAVVGPGTVMVWVPWCLMGHCHVRWPSSGIAGFAGMLLMLCGLLALAWCVLDFAWRGKGTPAPIDPPKHLVKSGLYRFTRNPMYVGVLMTLCGEALLWPSWTLVLYTAAIGAVFHLFIRAYEEPTLRRLFGEEYERYCAEVGRWLPRRPQSAPTPPPQ